MLQNNIIAAKGALHILWSTAGIKDVKTTKTKTNKKRRINPSYY